MRGGCTTRFGFSSPAGWEQPDSTQAGESVFGDDDMMPFARHPMLKLTDLETTRDFFGGDYGHVMLAYQTAADEVSRWLARVGRGGVPALTAAVADGNDFGDSYRQLERAKRRGGGKQVGRLKTGGQRNHGLPDVLSRNR